MRKSILLAVAPAATATLTSILEADFALTVSTTLADARERLRPTRIDLVLCGLYFDESRMFDLLRYAKADPVTACIPFFCINPTATTLPSTLLQSVEISSKALGAQEFIDLPTWQSRLGMDPAHTKLRTHLRTALAKPLP
jgi:hypothetical protein